MRRSWILLGLLTSCASPAPSADPPSAADRESLQARLRAALEAPYVMGKFYGEVEVDGKMVASCRGTSRGFRSGVVLLEEEPASGAPLRLLRVGDKAWIYDDGWKNAAGTRWAAAGTGFQNPYEMLSVLETAAEKFSPYRQGGISWSDGRNRALLNSLSDRAERYPPAGTEIEGVLKKGFRDGPLVTRISAETGNDTVWIAKMDIVNWGPAPPMQFDDIPAPFPPEMRAAVQKAQQGEGK